MSTPTPEHAIDIRVPLTFTNGTATFLIATVGLLTANLSPLIIVALQDALGMGATEAGGVVTASLLATALSSLLLGRWTAGRYRVLVARVGLIVAAIGFGLAAFNLSAVVTITGIIVGGIGGGAAVAAGGAALAAIRNPNRAAGINGLVNRLLATILLTAVPIAGIGLASEFGLLAVLSILALLTAVWLPRPRAAVVVEVPTVTLPMSVPTDRRATIVGVVLLLCTGLWAISEDSFYAVSAGVGIVQAGASDADLAVAYAAAGFAGIGAAFIVVLLGARLPRSLMLAVFIVLTAVLKVATGFASESTTFVVCFIAWQCFYAFALTYLLATAAALDASGRWSALLWGVYLIGSSLAPLIGSALGELVGYGVLSIILAALSIVVVPPLMWVARTSARREAEARAATPVAAADER